MNEEKNNILISVHNMHITNMLMGKKTIELRRRSVNVPNGTIVWIYNTMPIGSVTARAIIKDIIIDEPQKIWHQYNNRCCVNKNYYDDYFNGAKIACAILLEDINPLKFNLDLNTIRKHIKNFHPPQFFKKIIYNSPEFKLLNNYF